MMLATTEFRTFCTLYLLYESHKTPHNFLFLNPVQILHVVEAFAAMVELT
jgi:hypothetical protein